MKTKQWKSRETEEYPLCIKMEDTHHVLHYKSKAASEKWEDHTLEACLLDSNTLMVTVKMIAGKLHRWRVNDIELPMRN